MTGQISKLGQCTLDRASGYLRFFAESVFLGFGQMQDGILKSTRGERGIRHFEKTMLKWYDGLSRINYNYRMYITLAYYLFGPI